MLLSRALSFEGPPEPTSPTCGLGGDIQAQLAGLVSQNQAREADDMLLSCSGSSGKAPFTHPPPTVMTITNSPSAEPVRYHLSGPHDSNAIECQLSPGAAPP